MSNVNEVKLLSERTSGVPPVIFTPSTVSKAEICQKQDNAISSPGPSTAPPGPRQSAEAPPTKHSCSPYCPPRFSKVFFRCHSEFISFKWDKKDLMFWNIRPMPMREFFHCQNLLTEYWAFLKQGFLMLKSSSDVPQCSFCWNHLKTIKM